MLSPFLHTERAGIFPAVPVIFPPPFLALKRGSLRYHPESPGAVKLREGRVRTLPEKEEGSSSLMTTLPPPALTLLVVRDTKASLRHGQAERGSQTWFQDSFPCANLTSSTRNGLFSRAVFFFNLVWELWTKIFWQTSLQRVFPGTMGILPGEFNSLQSCAQGCKNNRSSAKSKNICVMFLSLALPLSVHCLFLYLI